jgi:hypothetical protein
MARIINHSDITLSIEAQEVLQQFAANIGGVETVSLTRASFNEEGEMFGVNFLGEADEYGERELIFKGAFDTDGNVIA